jgi:hypothetical protein
MAMFKVILESSIDPLDMDRAPKENSAQAETLLREWLDHRLEGATISTEVIDVEYITGTPEDPREDPRYSNVDYTKQFLYFMLVLLLCTVVTTLASVVIAWSAYQLV